MRTGESANGRWRENAEGRRGYTREDLVGLDRVNELQAEQRRGNGQWVKETADKSKRRNTERGGGGKRIGRERKRHARINVTETEARQTQTPRHRHAHKRPLCATVQEDAQRTHKPTHADNALLLRLNSFDTQSQQIDTQTKTHESYREKSEWMTHTAEQTTTTTTTTTRYTRQNN